MKIIFFFLLTSTIFSQGWYYARPIVAGGGDIPNYVDSSNAISTAANDSVQVTLPATVNVNDVLYIQALAFNDVVGNAPNIPTPSGWTLADQDSNSATYAVTGALFWKRADGTEDGTNVLVYFTAGALLTPDIKGVAQRFDGVITTGTPHEDLTDFNQLATGDDSLFTSLITTEGANRLAVCFIMVEDNSSVSAMVNYTETYDINTSTGRDMQFVVEVLDRPSSGDVAVDSGAKTLASDKYVSYTLALKPTP